MIKTILGLSCTLFAANAHAEWNMAASHFDDGGNDPKAKCWMATNGVAPKPSQVAKCVADLNLTPEAEAEVGEEFCAETDNPQACNQGLISRVAKPEDCDRELRMLAPKVDYLNIRLPSHVKSFTWGCYYGNLLHHAN